MLDATDAPAILRADRFGREFDLPIIVRDAGRAYSRLNAVVATGRALVVPVNFPKAPNVSTRNPRQRQRWRN